RRVGVVERVPRAGQVSPRRPAAPRPVPRLTRYPHLGRVVGQTGGGQGGGDRPGGDRVVRQRWRLGREVGVPPGVDGLPDADQRPGRPPTQVEPQPVTEAPAVAHRLSGPASVIPWWVAG